METKLKIETQDEKSKQEVTKILDDIKKHDYDSVVALGYKGGNMEVYAAGASLSETLSAMEIIKHRLLHQSLEDVLKASK